MATVKKTRPEAKKAVSKKKADTKSVSVKPAVKSVSSAKKTPVAKTKLPVKTKSLTIDTKSTPKKVVESNKSSKKDAVAVPSSNSKVKITPKPSETKKTIVTKSNKPEVKPVASVKKSEKESLPISKVKKTGDKSTKQEKVSISKTVKTINPTVNKNDDKLDPLHVKAAKAMKELSETMDLSKVRPRIQAGSPPPVPKPMPRQTAPPLKLIEPTNTNKTKFQIEFDFRSSPKILYNYLFDSSGLAGWFADEVKSKDNFFTFIWEGGESYAKLIASKEQHLVRFQWSEETDGTYFQFEIKEDDLTGDVALVITDFAAPGEKDSNVRLWESQVQKLRLLLGSF